VNLEELSLIIPAYNEENAIRSTISETDRVLSNSCDRYEIIIVDDCSSDRTAEFARECGVTVIRHPLNMGYGYSLKTGIATSKYEVVAICDADGTYVAEEFLKLFPYATDFDMVVGARTGKEFLGSGLKRLARWFQLKLVNFSTGNRIPDANSGMRLMRRSKLQEFLPLTCGGFSFTTSLTLAMLSTGKKVKYVPITYNPRIGSSHVRLFRDTLRSLQILVQAMVRYNPVKAFLSLAFIPWGLGGLAWLGAGLSFLSCRDPAWPIVLFSIGMMSFMAGIIVFAMGMLALACEQK